jgi:hypothetical protein
MCENNSPCKLIGGIPEALEGFSARHFEADPSPLVTVDIPPVLIANGLAENTRMTKVDHP